MVLEPVEKIVIVYSENICVALCALVPAVGYVIGSGGNIVAAYAYLAGCLVSRHLVLRGDCCCAAAVGGYKAVYCPNIRNVGIARGIDNVI